MQSNLYFTSNCHLFATIPYVSKDIPTFLLCFITYYIQYYNLFAMFHKIYQSFTQHFIRFTDLVCNVSILTSSECHWLYKTKFAFWILTMCNKLTLFSFCHLLCFNFVSKILITHASYSIVYSLKDISSSIEKGRKKTYCENEVNIFVWVVTRRTFLSE